MLSHPVKVAGKEEESVCLLDYYMHDMPEQYIPLSPAVLTKPSPTALLGHEATSTDTSAAVCMSVCPSVITVSWTTIPSRSYCLYINKIRRHVNACLLCRDFECEYVRSEIGVSYIKEM